MAVAGSLTYDTEIDKTGISKGLNSITNSVKSGGTKIKNIVSALGITKIISTAINTINNSIDGAVARIDTLNNFPKVMSNLGIASEESEKAINKLSDGLQGIPTKLDDSALAVQRFTSKNGDVDKSVDLFLAVNNALLAGGASAEIQSSAMEQLSQSYAKGKPDMVEWRAIQTAMPAQLKQISQEILGNKESLDIFLKKAKEYAKANPLSSSGAELIEQLEAVKKGSGDMTTALGTALRLGIISMDDFMDTIVKLNKEGSGEFLSFEEQAKNATGGIKTSITNAKTAITRGVTKIIEAFDQMLKDNGLGGISTVVNNIGKTSEKVLNKVASLIPKVVSKIKDACKWVKENQDVVEKLTIAIASLTAGYLAYKAVLVAVNAIQTVKKITGIVSTFLKLIPAIKSAKDAMLLFNMVSSANPIGLVIAGITALTTAFVAFSATQKSVKESVGNVATGFSDFYNGISTAKSHLDSFNSTLFASSEEQQKLKDEMQEIQNGITQICKTASDERRDYTQEEITQLDEYFAKLRELKNREIEIQNLIATAITQQATTNAETFNGSLEEYKVQSQEWINTAIQQRDATLQLIQDGTTQEIALLNQKYGEQANMQNEAYATEYNNIMTQQQQKIDTANQEVAQVLQVYQNGYLQRASQDNGFYTLMQEYNQKVEEEENRHNSAIDGINNNGLLTQYNKNKSKEDENYRHEQETKKIWENMYKNMSEEQANELGVWLAMVSQTEMYGGKIDDETREIVDSVIESFDSMPKETQEAMRNAMSPMLTEMEAKEPSLFAKAQGIADGILGRLKKSFEIQSPSKKMKKLFKYVMMGAEGGIDDETANLMKQVDDISENIIQKMNRAVSLETGAINANASVKSNNSMLNIINFTANIDGTVDLDSTKVGRLTAPAVCKTIKAGGLV